MVASVVQQTKRALVVLLRALAAVYGVQVTVNRDSPDKEVVVACRRVALKAHPDHGDDVRDQQRLNDARAAWEEARRKPQREATAPKPQKAHADSLLVQRGAPTRKEYRVASEAVLLTYQGIVDVPQWCRLVGTNTRKWKVKHWCATLETNSDGTFHAHVMLQFTSTVDRTTAAFVVEGRRPNASTNDLCGEGLCRKRCSSNDKNNDNSNDNNDNNKTTATTTTTSTAMTTTTSDNGNSQ